MNFLIEGPAGARLRAVIAGAGFVEVGSGSGSDSGSGSLALAVNVCSPPAEATCPIDQVDEAMFDRLVASVLSPCFLRMQAQLPAVERAGGVIVNVVSSLALEGRAGCAVIAACEHAIVGLTQSAARTFAGRARVNAVCVSPRFVGDEDAIARAVLGVASMPGVSGQTLLIDGGFTAY